MGDTAVSGLSGMYIVSVEGKGKESILQDEWPILFLPFVSYFLYDQGMLLPKINHILQPFRIKELDADNKTISRL